jgi:hypothetical protein
MSSTWKIAACSLSTIGCGVPAGARIPYHGVELTPG